MEELQYRLIESYRLPRAEKVFWKQILIQCILGVIFIVGALALFFSF